MSQQAVIHRYSLILEKVERKQYPSAQEILDFLEDNGFEVSKRTMQRDLEDLRNEFGVEVTYDSSRFGYYVDHENSINMEAFLRLLELANRSNLMIESLRESKNSLDHVSFESNGSLHGIENLKNLLLAVRNKRKIRFRHENFLTGKSRMYKVRPYMLKEYLNRWYLVGRISTNKEFRNFGIDRISELEVTSETFTRSGRSDPRDLFESTIGLTYSVADPELIELSLTPIQGKYIKSLPMHHSQEKLVDNEKEYRVSLYVVPNMEFIQRILMLGEQVKVVNPDWLAEKVKEHLQNAIDRY